jgi:protein ImuB
MTAGRDLPERVLVIWCPVWPQAPEAGAAGNGTARGGADGARDAGRRPRRAPEFGQVVSVVEGFCPRVEVLRPGACAIGARGPARYFGGERALAAKIIAAVADGGFTGQVGIADGLFAACLAAEHARETRHGRPAPAAPPGAVMTVAPGRTRAFLAPFPVSALDGPDAADLADLLSRLGIRTLGEFAALPPAEVTNRFGARGVTAHRLARGLDPRPLAPRPPPAGLSVWQEFDPPARQAEPVVFAAKALAERMHNGLAASGLACVRVQVQAVWKDGREVTRLWRHDGLLTPLAIADRVRWTLSAPSPGGEQGTARIPAPRGARKRTTAGYPPGSRRGGQGGDGQGGDDAVQAGGITLLRLTPDQLVRDQGRQLGLWGDAVVSDRVARAAIRVQAILGHGAVTYPVPAGGRGPADQVTLVPFGGASDQLGGPDRPWPGRMPAPSPATVYPAPLPARVADGSGAAVAVSGRGLVSAPPAQMSADGAPWLAVTAWAGPWPVTERWWHPRGARRRARFQLVTEDGAGWLVAVQDGGWLIEARYD